MIEPCDRCAIYCADAWAWAWFANALHLILSLKSLNTRMHGSIWPLAEIKRSTVDQVWRRFDQPADQLLAREAKRLIQELDLSIQRLEEHILKQTGPCPSTNVC